MTTSTTRRIAALSAALALPLTLLAATPATAATVGVATWAELKSAFLVNGDTVRLDADITADALDALAVEAGESIVLNLNGYTLTITNPGSGPAVSVPPTSSLTVTDTSGGILIATGGDLGAGIGGGLFSDGGTVTINGGTITATGATSAAGIGGGAAGGAGGITTINGGTVTATGGFYGAGIGGGQLGTGGITTINGGTVTAIGGLYAAGIGGGEMRPGGTTTINGGTVTASGGQLAAGIGGSLGQIGAILVVNGTRNGGTATDGGNPSAAVITNPPTPPAGVGYSATTSTNSNDGGTIELRFNYLIAFSAAGGSSTAPQTINDGDTLTPPAAPTREGFTFAGWTSGGSAYDFSTPVTAPLELTASWTPVLAETGANVNVALGLASLLLAGGIALIALRRRTLSRSA